jgi:hypothetical protein
LHSKWAFTLVRLSYAESKNCKFHGSQKFGVDLNLREWWVGERIAGRQWLCYCSAAAVANKGNNKRMAACSHTAAGVSNQTPDSNRPTKFLRRPDLFAVLQLTIFTVCCHSVFNFAGLSPDHSVKSNALPLLPPRLNLQPLTIFHLGKKHIAP